MSSIPARNGEHSFWMTLQADDQPPRPALIAIGGRLAGLAESPSAQNTSAHAGGQQ